MHLDRPIGSGLRPSNKFRHSLIIAVFFALLAFTLSLRYTHDFGFNYVEPYASHDQYMGPAFNLAAGIGYHDCTPVANDYHCDGYYPWETAFRVPGYPLYLAGNILIFGVDSPLASMRLLQSVLAAMIVYLATMLAGRLVGPIAALVAGLIISTDVLLQIYASVLLTEILFTFLLLLFVCLASGSRRPERLLFAGLVLGLALMVRSSAVFILVLLPFFYIPRKYVLLIFAGAFMVAVPWAVRNALTFRAFIPFGTESGVTLWAGNNAVVYGIDPPGPPSGDYYNTVLPHVPDIYVGDLAVQGYFTSLAVQFVRSVPLPTLAWAVLAKLARFIGLYAPWNIASTALLPVGIWLAVLIAQWRAIRRDLRASLRRVWQVMKHPILRLTLVMIVAGLGMTVITFGDPRYRTPIDPYLAILSGGGVAQLIGRATWDHGDKPTPVAERLTGKTQLRLARGFLVAILLIELFVIGRGVATTVVSDHTAQDTATWLVAHVADYSRLVIRSDLDNVVTLAQAAPTSSAAVQTWDWKKMPVVQASDVSSSLVAGIHYVVVDDRAIKSDFEAYLHTLVDQGATIVYQSSNPLGLGDHLAVLWTFRPQHVLNLTFDNSLFLVGYTVQKNDRNQIDLLMHWYTQRPTNKAFHIFVHLIDPQTGQVLGQADTQVGQGSHPTDSWRPNEIVFDPIVLPTDVTSSGKPFRLEVGLYDLVSGARAPITDEHQNHVGDHFTIETLDSP